MLISARLFAVLLVFSFSSATSSATPLIVPKVKMNHRYLRLGGSNFNSFHNAQEYQQSWDPIAGRYDATLIKTIVGRGHEDPAKIRLFLQQIKNSGQSRVSTMIYFANFGPNLQNDLARGYKHHLVPSNGGRLPAQQEANLNFFLQEVRRQGFKSLTIRFASQGSNDPSHHTCADFFDNHLPETSETPYSQNLAFVKRVTQSARAAIAGSPTELKIDLGAELAGKPTGCSELYVKRLWQDFTNAYPGAANFAYYSVNPVREGTGSSFLLRYIGWMRSLAPIPMPKLYAVDVYGYGLGQNWPVINWDIYSMLRDISADLLSEGEIQRPVVIQETFYNDPVGVAAFQSALENLPMNIESINQWPVDRATHQLAVDRGTTSFASADAPVAYGPIQSAYPRYTRLHLGQNLSELTEDSCSGQSTNRCLSMSLTAARADSVYLVTIAHHGLEDRLVACKKGGAVELPALPIDESYALRIHTSSSCVGTRVGPIQTELLRRYKP